MTEENLTKLLCTAGSLGDFQDAHDYILPQFPPPAFVNFPFHRHVAISLFPLERVNKWIGYQMLWGFLSFSSHILRIWVRFLPFLSASLQPFSMLEKSWYSVTFVFFTQ
jgi:hypothetical protein